MRLLFTILFCFAFACSYTQIITTVAGKGTFGYSGDSGLALNASLEPQNISFDSHDNLFITDPRNNVIRKVNAATGIITTVAGNGTAGFSGDSGLAIHAQLNNPFGAIVDSTGNIYISDDGNYRIRKVDAKTGIITTIAGTGMRGYAGDGGPAIDAEFQEPAGCALDSANKDLYVADVTGNRIKKIDLTTGIITTISGSNSIGQTNGDGGLAVNAILYQPITLAIDAKDNIYISEFDDYKIRKINAADNIITTICGNGINGHTGDSGLAVNAELGYVWGLALDKNNNLYLPDWSWNVVRKINLTDNIISTVAGVYNNGAYGYGILATQTILGQPWSVATDSKNNFYFPDVDFAQVQKVTVDSFALNELTGYSYYDFNKNNVKDSSEPFFSEGKIKAKKNTDSSLTLTSSGNFRIGLDTGSYISSFVPFKAYYTTVPQTHISRFVGYNNLDTVNFALQSIAGKTDINVSMYSLLPSRPGFDNIYKIKYNNAGTDTIASGEIQLVKDPRYAFVSASPAYTSIKGDTLRWTYSNFKPLDTASIAIQLALSPGVKAGDTVHLTATISPVIKDLDPSDDTASIKQIAVSSYDPNNKSENHGGSVTTTQVRSGDYLTYTILFQNTGTYAAYNIIVKDTLSNDLDWSSFEMVDASNNYQLNITGGNKCAWHFNAIGLPDSGSNEAASHGYIVYRIKLKTTLAPGNIVYNSAGIYFDYNAPVKTNMQQTIVVNSILPVTFLSFTAQKQSSTVLLQWQTANEINNSYFGVERSADGRLFSAIGEQAALKTSSINNYSFIDNAPVTGNNFYRLKQVDKDGKFTYSGIVTVEFSNGGTFVVYPNPASSSLNITVPSSNSSSQLMMFDVNGKKVMSDAVSSNIISKQINISKLPAGVYNVVLMQDGKQQTVKIVKK